MTQDAHHDPMLHTLRAIRRRLLAQRGFRYFGWTLLGFSFASCLWVIASRLFPVLGDPVPVVAAIGALSFAAYLWMLIVHRPTISSAALEADRALGLKERITSSLALAEQTTGMAAAVHADARRYLAGLKVSAAFPFSVPKPLRWAVLPLLAFGLAYTFFPEFDLLQYRQRQAEAKTKSETVALQAERLREAARVVDAEKAPTPELGELAESVQAIAADLESGALEEKAALAQISNLAREARQRRESLTGERSFPALDNSVERFGPAKDLAKAIQDGRMGDAAKAANELMKKMQEGNLSPEEVSRLKKEMKQLSEMLGENSAVAEALAKAAASLDAESLAEGLEAIGQMQMSLEELQQTLEQLQQLENLQFKLAQWQSDMMGESEYCRICGQKSGVCETEGTCPGSGHGHGPGMGGRGMGQGNRVGDLPDVDGTFDPAKATGPLTKGQMLADILQKAAPDSDAQPTVDLVNEAFIEFRQEAEQALAREEIPAGSREYVRQYFLSLEPQANPR